MACATLKRTIEWDPLHSPNNKPKRRRCMPLTLSPPNIAKTNDISPSPFGPVSTKWSSEEIAANIRDEVKRLQRRKHLHIANSSGRVSPSASSPPSPPSSSSGNGGVLNHRDQPLFTYRQIGLICERMLKERENEIRIEYEKVLNAKLSEQYETFVKFSRDQLQRSFENGIPSYLS